MEQPPSATTTIPHLLPAHSTTLWSKIDAKAPVGALVDAGRLWSGRSLTNGPRRAFQGGLWGGRFPSAAFAPTGSRGRISWGHACAVNNDFEFFLLTCLAVVQNKIMAEDILPSGVQPAVRANSIVKEAAPRRRSALPCRRCNVLFPLNAPLRQKSRQGCVVGGVVVVCDHCESTAGGEKKVKVELP